MLDISGKKTCPKCKKDRFFHEFGKNKSKKDGLQYACKLCSTAIVKAYYKENTPARREKQVEIDKVRRSRRHKWFIEYLLEHPCIDCGESDILVLQFDHIIPIKNGHAYRFTTIGGLTREQFEVEVAKCKVRCANCHVKRHRIESGDYRYLYQLYQQNIRLRS